MNRNQGGYSFSTHSPEPSEYTAAMSTGDRMTPRRPPSGPRTGQPGGFGNGSLRTTRSSGGAFARTNQPSLPRVRTGTMQRRPIYDAPTSPYDRTPDYTSPTGGSGFQPYIPDGGDRRTPELHAATRTIDYSYNEAPMDGAGGIRRYRVDGHMSPYEPAMAGEEGRHVVGSARLMAGRSEMQGVSQRVEFGYTAPAPRATYAHSDSSEHDEIAEIIADMSKAQMPAGVVDLGDDRHVYLQLGEDTKRVRLPEPVTQTTLIQLFIEKYRARLAEEVNTLPSIYIKDPVSGHFYELEEMADVVDGSVLSWRAQPTQPTAAASTAAAEPKKQEEEEEEKVPSAMQAQIEGLAEIVRALADSVAKLPEQLRGELATAVGSVNEQILAQNARVDAALTAASSAAAAAAAAAAKSKANSDDKPATKSAPVSTEGSSEELSEQLASALKRLDAAELALGVERQERRETESALRQEKEAVEKALQELKDDVGSHPSVLRKRIESGKERLKTEYRAMNSQFEDVDAMVQAMRKDVTQRGSIPSAPLLRKANDELKAVADGSEALMRFINETRPDWKLAWEAELQNILKEQSFVKDVEQMLTELIDDARHLDNVLDKLEQVVDLRAKERASEGYVPAAATRFIDVVSADEASDAKQGLLRQITCVDVDHDRRLDALQAAEKLRQQELAAKVNEFDQELADFVGQRKLRKTGGTEELERKRMEKESEVMKEMMKSVEEAEQARRAKIAQRKAAKQTKK